MSDNLKNLDQLINEIGRHGTCFLNDQDTIAYLKAAQSEIASLRFRVLNQVRSSDPDTSKAAQPAFRPTETHWTLLGAFVRYGDLTADEAAEIAGMANNRSCYWKRISELASIGYLENTDQTRQGLAGRQQMVRTISEAGLDAYERLHRDRT